MPKIVRVNSRSSGSQGSNPYILSYGSETWLVERYSDAENCKGQFKVIRGQFPNSEIILWKSNLVGGDIFRCTKLCRSIQGHRDQIHTYCLMEVKLCW